LERRIRVVIADDQALVRAGFRSLLDPQPDIDVLAEAGDGEQAVSLAANLAPDIVLMDIRMPASTAWRPRVASAPTRVSAPSR
jgi:DNA-binding NarL/FixJ family response regulator